MRAAAFSAIVIASAVTTARGESRALFMAEPASRPLSFAIAKDVRTCRAGTGANLVRDGQLTIGATRVASLRECLADNQEGYLAMQHGTDWFVAHTTRRLQLLSTRITTLETRLAAGTLADGSLAIVHRIDLRHQVFCQDPRCTDAGRWHQQFVMVCSLPREDDLGAGVVCGSVEHVCPRGCKDVTLRDGVLHARDRDGPVEYTVIR